jgi:hypothetical protein
MPKNDDLGFKSSLGPEPRNHEAQQKLQTVDHRASEPIRALMPRRMRFSPGTGHANLEALADQWLALEVKVGRVVCNDEVLSWFSKPIFEQPVTLH